MVRSVGGGGGGWLPFRLVELDQGRKMKRLLHILALHVRKESDGTQ